MTVAELIAELSKHPPDMPVVITWLDPEPLYGIESVRLQKVLEHRIGPDDMPCYQVLDCPPEVNLSAPCMNVLVISLD